MGKTILAVLPQRPRPSRGMPAPERWRKGVLMAPVWIEGRLRGEPGRVIRYRESGDRLDIVVGAHRLVKDVPYGQMVPYHPEFTPCRVYLHLTRCKPENERQPLDKYLLAINVAREFEEHELREDLMLLACRYAEAYERRGAETGYPRTRMLMVEYLRAHPRGRFKDWMEYKSVQLKYSRRERHGDVAGPLSAIQAYQRLLATRPRNAHKNKIKLRMARLYRMAYECIAFTECEENRRGLTMAHAQRFLKRSEYLYKGLLENPDPQARNEARVGLFNMGQSRSSSDDW